ncbi:MAG: class I SAM-dependent methyltransferase [Anaerovorax sp.]|nr:class I SAM-dependent methyltransferase [Anaerovorax sp.]
MNLFKNAVEISKRICEQILKEGDIAIDCTMGNGNDTVFLCSLIGENGKVYAFDIQESAVVNTRQNLLKYGYLERAELILDGHQNIDKYVKEEVRLILFNLGYLPKGNHDITTKKDTTIEAVEKCINILKPKGVILLVIYPGHLSGSEEKEALENFTSNLNQKEFTVTKLCFLNQIHHPPELICIEKV